MVVQIIAPLPAPQRLRATAEPNAVRLDWEAVAAATGYRVFRRRGEQTLEFFSAEPPFQDPDVVWETPVAYFVRALAATPSEETKP